MRLTAAEIRADDVISVAGEARTVLTAERGAHYVAFRTAAVDDPADVRTLSYPASATVDVRERRRRVGAVTIPADLALELVHDLRALKHLTAAERRLQTLLYRDIPTERF